MMNSSSTAKRETPHLCHAELERVRLLRYSKHVLPMELLHTQTRQQSNISRVLHNLDRGQNNLLVFNNALWLSLWVPRQPSLQQNLWENTAEVWPTAVVCCALAANVLEMFLHFYGTPCCCYVYSSRDAATQLAPRKKMARHLRSCVEGLIS